jgi:hypothetical protein
LDKKYYSTTFFILHFAFIDMLHCLFIVVPLGLQYCLNTFVFGRHACKIVLQGGVITFVADMLAIALIALSRCLDMIINQKWTKLCEKRRNIFLLLLFVWIPSLITSTFLFIVQSYGVELGWKCETGGCGFLHSCQTSNELTEPITNFIDRIHYIPNTCHEGIAAWRLTYFSTICVPIFSLAVISISYIAIWLKVHKSTKYFANTKEVANQLSQRDIKMTKTILILVVLNFLFWLPYGILINTALDLTDHSSPYTAEQYITTIVLVTVFESQYAINFFVYALRHEQYRNAFIDLMRYSGAKQRRSTMSQYSNRHGNDV